MNIMILYKWTDVNHINRECLIDGNKKHYDACSTKSLTMAKESLNNFKYIGSSHTYYINGTENESEQLHHFFIKNIPMDNKPTFKHDFKTIFGIVDIQGAQSYMKAMLRSNEAY